MMEKKRTYLREIVFPNKLYMEPRLDIVEMEQTEAQADKHYWITRQEATSVRFFRLKELQFKDED